MDPFGVFILPFKIFCKNALFELWSGAKVLSLLARWMTVYHRCKIQCFILALPWVNYSNQTFQLLAYEVEHVFSQIFSGSVELSFIKVLKRTALQKCINQNSGLKFNLGLAHTLGTRLGLALIALWTAGPKALRNYK